MVIAERNKIICIFPLFISLLMAFVCICFKVEIEAKFIVALIFGIISLPFGLYSLLSPKNAIILENDSLIVNYLFYKKKILIDDIEYVSTNELGEYYNRRSSISSDVIYFTDTRRLFITYNIDGIKRHLSVFVKNASAVKVSIDSLVKKK